MEKWPEVNGQLEKEFELTDFMSAISFANRIAEKAEIADHHPDIFIHSYKKVRISMMTHSEGKITEKDHDLAREIDTIYISL